MRLFGKVRVLQDLEAQLLEDLEAVDAVSQLQLAVLASPELFNSQVVGVVLLLPFGLVNIIDGGRKGKHNVILIYFFVLVELEFGDGQAEEQNFLPAGNACDVL